MKQHSLHGFIEEPYSPYLLKKNRRRADQMSKTEKKAQIAGENKVGMFNTFIAICRSSQAFNF